MLQKVVALTRIESLKVFRKTLSKIEKEKWFGSTHHIMQNIGQVFLKLVQKHFPQAPLLNKIFNTNTIKLRYSCNPNVKNLTKQHNSSIMKRDTNTNKKDYNCRDKDNCPLDGNCFVECIVYEATISKMNQTNTYFGSAEGNFKSRYNNHTLSFHSKGYKHRTDLSKYAWSLQDSNTEFSLKWHIKKLPYKCSSQKCDLRIAEKVAITQFEGAGLLNKQTKLLSKCRQRNKFIIVNIK